jgi:hypothetical protein
LISRNQLDRVRGEGAPAKLAAAADKPGRNLTPIRHRDSIAWLSASRQGV